MIAANGAAAASSYTWYDGKVKSGTTLTEKGNSLNWQRKGVSANLPKANGSYFTMTVWLGSSYGKGSTSANVSSTKLVKSKTKEKWTYRLDPDDAGKLRTVVTVKGVPGGGGMVAPTDAGTDVAARIIDLAETSNAETTTPGEPRLLSSHEGESFWMYEGGESVTFAIRMGDIVGSTVVSKSEFLRGGAPLTVHHADRTVSAVLTPDPLSARETAQAGLVPLGSNVYLVTDGAEISSEVRSRSGKLSINTSVLEGEE